ncbi:MAG: aldehyde dehydrogenase family protein [Armatimonadota bacterium]|nr:aldehyde dehydrogenase family protein [Armatimonadota bacterium]MDR7450887.1 aldehyde dehydrogenase family protein [Armatimonadota bacterium]MDR7465809.1 aldehyde dehydrogenase family protein [Armatimonadota bacterium]MDR7493717.1 aldehyde dehydrogenase family protein [Armatimonadota bacterium]MDR7498323.1 aldehyde dehydrogenase family protein [Armatimonadota bacterium]
MAERFKVLVAGEWVDSSGGTVTDLNPADTSEVVAEFPAMTAEDVTRAVEAAAEAFSAWKALTWTARGAVLRRASELIRERLEVIARDLTREMGKTLREARGEVARASSFFDYYGAYGRLPIGDHLPDERAGVFTYTVREPLGVVVAIAPWNDPALTPARKLAPALIAGNTVVLKPATLTPLSAWHLLRALHDAGLPRGVVNMVTGPARATGDPLVRHPAVRAITFTGSTAVGLDLQAKVAGRNIRVQTEMGGKNAMVVLKDADVRLAAELAVAAGFGQSGQRCTATSRVIVERPLAEAFVHEFVARAGQVKVGPGLADDTTMGPVVDHSQLETVLDAVERGRREGAEVLFGGERLGGPLYARGYFVAPTILGNVSPTMAVAQEEIFGPVVAVMEAEDLAQAVEIVNTTRYGLSASVVTRSLSAAHAFARGVETGCVAVNLPTVGWDVHTPFGGFKDSGSAFKEHGIEGLQFYTRVKSVAMRVE